MKPITNDRFFCQFLSCIKPEFQNITYIGDRMKKIIIIFVIGFVFYGLFLKNSVKATELLVPNDAIRMRVIPNSNSNYDQMIKAKVKEELQTTTYELLKDTKGSEEAKSIIEANLDLIDNHINDLLIRENYNLGYKINFGYNYFPEKNFKGVSYAEGYYQSLLVTLGEGKGDNWWCVLFPPMCLMEAEESTEVEYKFFIKELIDKYL